jgi:hypothetical protein
MTFVIPGQPAGTLPFQDLCMWISFICIVTAFAMLGVYAVTGRWW